MHVRVDFFKKISKFELPLLEGQTLQSLLHCNTRVGGWVGISTTLFLFLLHLLFRNTMRACIMELFVILPNWMCCTIWTIRVID